MRGLFIEPFYGGSHKAFADGLSAQSRHEITLLTLPGGEWRQRMRRGAQELSGVSTTIDGDFEFIIATDMLDVAMFLALARPRFSDVPVLLYMHENQFTYPRLTGTKLNSWFGQINYTSALVADIVAFNSEYHRSDFLMALEHLSRVPNNWLVESSVREVTEKSVVLPVGVELEWLDALPRERSRPEAPLILWSHRWEFDKAPDVFVRALEQLATAGYDFGIAIAGEPGQNPHPAIAMLPAGPLAGRLRHFGHLEDREAYGRLLWDSDFAVSTTRHEFFGIATVEAMAAGCVPIAPARYNYPALVPTEYHQQCLWNDEAGLLALLRWRLTTPIRNEERTAMRLSALRYAWPVVGPTWDEAIDKLAHARPAKLSQNTKAGRVVV